MKWTALADEGGYRRLDIEAPWDDVADEYEGLVSRYAATVRLPGFRPGKAPRGAIEQRFRTEILADFSARVVQRLGRDAVREAGVEALGPVQASDVECGKGGPFRARVRYFPMPEIRLPALEDLAGEDDGTDPRDRICRRLLDRVPFEVPADMVRDELRVDGFEESGPGSDDWYSAAERIRLMVILRRIAAQEGIEVEEADLSGRIAAKAEEFGATQSGLRADLERGGGAARLRDMLLAERTLEYLMEMARGQD